MKLLTSFSHEEIKRSLKQESYHAYAAFVLETKKMLSKWYRTCAAYLSEL